MNRGDKVIATTFPDLKSERVVWETRPDFVILCRPEIFESAIMRGEEPESTMGFKYENVVTPTNANE